MQLQLRIREFGLLRKQRGETLVSIVVGVSILALVIFAITNILTNSILIEDDYMKSNTIHLLDTNAANIASRLDTSFLNEGETFYVEKNPADRIFIIHTGSTNSGYQYIDASGEHIPDIGSFTGTAYSRTFILDQLVKGTIRELPRN